MPRHTDEILCSAKTFENMFKKQKDFSFPYSNEKEISEKQLEFSFRNFEFEETKNSKLGLNCYLFFIIFMYSYYVDSTIDKDPIFPYIYTSFVSLLLAALAAIYFSLHIIRLNKFFHEAFAYIVAIYNIFHLVAINITCSEKENNSKITASYFSIMITFFNIMNTYDVSIIRLVLDVLVNLALFVLVTLYRIDSDKMGIEDILMFIVMTTVAFMVKEQKVSEYRKIFVTTCLDGLSNRFFSS